MIDLPKQREMRYMNPEIRTAKNWYWWLWLSPLLTLPTVVALSQFLTFGGPGYELICGRIWSAVNTDLNNTNVGALAIDPMTPATLYAGTGNDGAFKSTNGGGNWSAVNTGLTNTEVHALAIDPMMPATLYAGTKGGGVFKSLNGGSTWSAVNTGLTEPKFLDEINLLFSYCWPISAQEAV